MNASVVLEILLIFFLILLNGFFSGAEIAVLTARRGRLEAEAARGARSANLALRLARDPDFFLATVQVGITLVGTFAAAFGGASLTRNLREVFLAMHWSPISDNAHAIALATITVSIAFVSLLIGELVPKRLGLAHAESFALWVARPMSLMATLTRPIVRVLELCCRTLLFLIGQHRAPKQSVSIDDIQHMIEAGTSEGVLQPAERRVAVGGLRLGDRIVRDIQVPRVEMEAIDIETPSERVLAAIAASRHSRMPVYEGQLDHIVGFVYIKDVIACLVDNRPIELRKLLRTPVFIPETTTIDRLLQEFQSHGVQLAIVLDEYGGTEGLVTIEDVLEELVGEIHDEIQEKESLIVQREDGSWLVDGSVRIDIFFTEINEPMPAVETAAGVSTISGLVLTELGHLPEIGDSVTWQNLSMEVVDMDGRRIDRLLIRLLEKQENPTTD